MSYAILADIPVPFINIMYLYEDTNRQFSFICFVVCEWMMMANADEKIMIFLSKKMNKNKEHLLIKYTNDDDDNDCGDETEHG